MILGEVSLRGRNAPLDRALIRFFVAHEDLEEHRHGKLVLAEDGDLVLLADNEAHVVEQLFTVDGLADIRHEQAILARLTLRLEADPRIAAAGGGHILNGDLLEQLAAGRCLTGL